MCDSLSTIIKYLCNKGLKIILYSKFYKKLQDIYNPNYFIFYFYIKIYKIIEKLKKNDLFLINILI
jgi:hypothetical protein